MKIVIGCDPDSAGNGIAVFEQGKLEHLGNYSAVEFYLKFINLKGEDVTFSIENVSANGGVFRAAGAKSKSLAGAMGKSVGMCMQAQTEIEKAAKLLGFEIVHRPRSPKWKKGSQVDEFKRCTGWTKRSNEDTRSAAWQGYSIV